MKKKKNTVEPKLRSFFEKKGFYIALFSLVVIIGLSVYTQRSKDIDESSLAFDDDAWQEAIKESEIVLEEKETNNTSSESIEEISNNPKDGGQETERTPEKKISMNDINNEEEIESIPVVANAGVFNMKFPCDGKIIADCSLEDLIYCKQMDDWRTHNGIDIAATEGTSVKAASAGVVSEVYEDDLLGVVVVLDHLNGISSLYGNLQSSDFIQVGTEVKTGDIIGGVGKPGALETGTESHLHFEVLKNGEYENPSTYLN